MDNVKKSAKPAQLYSGTTLSATQLNALRKLNWTKVITSPRFRDYYSPLIPHEKQISLRHANPRAPTIVSPVSPVGS